MLKPETLPTLQKTEWGSVPDDWDVCPVGSKGDVLTGKALAARAPGVQRPYLRTKNVFDGRINIDDVLTMPMTDEQFSLFRIRRDDVLLNEGQSLELVGRCSIYKEEFPEPCAMQNQLLRFRAHKGVSPLFASHLFRHCQSTGVFAKIALQTTSIAHLGGSRFAQLRLAWPPTYDEQQAIAEALSDADALIEELERLIVKKRAIKQGAMQDLLSGRCRLPGFSGEWGVRKLGSVARIQRGASPRPIDDPIWFDDNSKVGWVRISDVTSSGMYLTETTQWLSTAGIRNSRPVSSGSLIMSICATVGRPVITNLDVCIHDGFVVFENLEVDQVFLYYFLQSIEGDWAKRGQTGSQMNLNTGLINGTELFLPEKLAEQQAIAHLLADLDNELLGIEDRLRKARQIKQGMMQELLTGRVRLV